MEKKNEQFNVLIIVDPQYDFVNGSLAVPNALNAMVDLNAWLYGEASHFDVIFITADWHPYTHCSFKNNGGEWPTHCVQHSHGAAIYQSIIDAINEQNLDFTVLTKGDNEDREEYSVFANEKSRSIIIKSVPDDNNTEITFVGLAGDYCVKNSVSDALRFFPNAKINVIERFSPSIDDGTTLRDFANKSERVNLIKA